MSKESEYGKECSVKDYICDNGSICREERQYAVFLYNILQKYKTQDSRNAEIRKIFEVCNIPLDATVEAVFYEAALMRDFFELERKCKKEKCDFNQKLIRYVSKKEIELDNSDNEYNLGHYSISSDKVSGQDKYIIKCMMNAKPDIAVIYHCEAGGSRLLFLECKFESSESSYKYTSKSCESSDEDKWTQREIQWKIADFLCEYYLNNEGIKISEAMKNEKKSCLVRFGRKMKGKSEQPSNEILIEQLIELNKRIFA